MPSARSQRSRGSLGDSWGDADYSSDGGASIHSVSDIDVDDGSAELGNDLRRPNEYQDAATPLPTRFTRASSHTPRETPVKSPATRHSRQSRSPRTPQSQRSAYKSSPASEGLEPSFIMPSMYGSPDGFSNGSPLRAPNMGSSTRARKPRRSSQYSQPYSNQSSPKISSQQHSADNPEDQNPNPWHYVKLVQGHVIWPLMQYILSVLGIALDFAKPLIGTALVGVLIAWAIFGILGSTSVRVQSAIQTVMSPICAVPGSSYVFSYCDYPKYEYHDPAFDDLMKAQSNFEEILHASQDSLTLPASMKRSQVTIRDLKTLAKFSRLPSKAQLEVEFQGFIDTAGQASDDLTKYNSKIGVTMDHITRINIYTARNLEGLAEQEARTGAVSRFLGAINPLNSFMASPSLQQRIFEEFTRNLRDVKQATEALIDAAQALLLILRNLEGRLEVIAELAAHDGLTVGRAQEELLGQIWTMLGGNKGDRKQLEESLRFLKQITATRNQAVMLVETTLLKLQEINAEMENLREGVAAPEVLGIREGTPVQFHIDAIYQQIDRLARARGEQQTLQDKETRKMLDRLDAIGGLPGRDREDLPMISAKSKGKKVEL